MNGIISPISFSMCLSLEYGKAADLRVLILYLAVLLNVLTSSKCFLLGSSGSDHLKVDTLRFLSCSCPFTSLVLRVKVRVPALC